MVLQGGGSNSLLRQAVLSDDGFILPLFFTDPVKGELDRLLEVKLWTLPRNDSHSGTIPHSLTRQGGDFIVEQRTARIR